MLRQSYTTPAGRRPITFTCMDGEEVALLTLPDGEQTVLSAQTARELLALGYLLGNARANSNGKDRSYVVFKALLPPWWKEVTDGPVTHRLQRLVCALVSDRTGGPLPAKGWVAKLVGSHLDLRDHMVKAEPAEGRRNDWETIAGLRARQRLLADGLDPQAEFERGWRERRAREAGGGNV